MRKVGIGAETTKTMEQEMEALKAENEALRMEIEQVKAENEALKADEPKQKK